jgi:hypothetical protein
MVEILIRKIQRPFLAHFLPASQLGVCCNHNTELGENSHGGGGGRNRSENGWGCMGLFVWYHLVPITSTPKIQPSTPYGHDNLNLVSSYHGLRNSSNHSLRLKRLEKVEITTEFEIPTRWFQREENFMLHFSFQRQRTESDTLRNTVTRLCDTRLLSASTAEAITRINKYKTYSRLNSVNQLIFVMVKCGVLFEVRTEFLNNI